jgi:hypothetical protein
MAGATRRLFRAKWVILTSGNTVCKTAKFVRFMTTMFKPVLSIKC